MFWLPQWTRDDYCYKVDVGNANFVGYFSEFPILFTKGIFGSGSSFKGQESDGRYIPTKYTLERLSDGSGYYIVTRKELFNEEYVAGIVIVTIGY